MNNNNFFYFNYYEKHLSPFGKKVLQELIQRRHTERQEYRIIPVSQNLVQKKRILQFGEDNTNKPSVSQSNVRHEINSSITYKNNTNSVGKTITSAKLLKIINNNNDMVIEPQSRDDLIHPVNSGVEETGRCRPSDNEDNNQILNIIEEKSKTNGEIKKTSIPWDDMFTTDSLFSDMHEIEKTTYEIHEENIIPCPDSSNDNNFENKKISEHKKEIKGTKKVSKNVKETSKNILRKQKYTKTVKKWLNDVSVNRSVEEGTIAESEANVKENTLNVNKIISERVITKNIGTNKAKKNVVQAQLANKNGIMKFSKPTNVISDNIETNMEEDNKNVKDKPKDRKSKAKFVAPIKSQIPVKDITYEIHIIDDFNIETHAIKLSINLNKEIIAVLVYSNGFNQLNCHYTDTVCEPDGLIINIDEEFYYFKEISERSRYFFANFIKQKLICYEAKHILNHVATAWDVIASPDCIIDVKIGSCLLEPDNPPENFSEVQKVVSSKPQFTVATECRLQKTAWYLTLLKQCVATMTDLLIQNSLWNVFVNIEMRLVPIVAAMERRGVAVDLQKLKSMEEVLTAQLKSVEQRCYKAAGKSFQINSPAQISAILYDELQLDAKCNVKIRETLCKGAKSTSETMLRSLMSEHPLPRWILEYRHVHKAHATFVAGIAHHVRDGVVAPTWEQTAAATGRIASNNPNLQAIPKTPFSLVMFAADEEKEDCPELKFRSVYSSRSGYQLLSADFRHVECRVWAHVAADTSLLHALAPTTDLFTVLAAQWLQKAEGDVTSEDRERTKRIIYATMYGAGTRKLMDILNISYDQTLAIVSSFNRTFPSLKWFGRSVVSRCEQNGGRLSTICGRTRVFQNISSGDFALRSQAERQAVNFVVQGSAADLCKMAMILTNEEFAKHNPPVEAHLVLQIHDELVWEVKEEHLHTATVITKQVMESCGQHCGMTIHLPVSVRVGTNWADMILVDA